MLGLNKIYDSKEDLKIDVAVECFPEYTHFLTDKLVDSWYLYKIEHSICLL